MWGFYPRARESGARRSRNSPMKSRTLVLYESPHRIADTLADALNCLGRRPAVIAREVTKLHEEFLRGDLAELLLRVKQHAPRGEMTLLIGPATPGRNQRLAPQPEPLHGRVENIMRERLRVDQKAALKIAARERRLTKREAYKQLLSGN